VGIWRKLDGHLFTYNSRIIPNTVCIYKKSFLRNQHLKVTNLNMGDMLINVADLNVGVKTDLNVGDVKVDLNVGDGDGRNNAEGNDAEEHKDGIISLPNNMLMEVLTKVASSSFVDLFKAKLICKDFCGLAEEDHIFQQVSLEKISLFWCTKVEVLFLRRCKECENPYTLFREGIYWYFTLKNPELGLKFLEKAS
jgi:hypothetical protein